MIKMDLEKICKSLKGKEFDWEYVKGCEEFKQYDSFDEYVRDVMICLMIVFNDFDLKGAKERASHEMITIRHSFEIGECAFDSAIDVGYTCG